MLQDAPTKRYSVLVSISNTSIKRILIRCENTNGVIFAVFLQDLIDDLKLKYDEYFVKLIIRWEGAKYHKIEEIRQIFRKIRKDDGYYCSIYIAEFSQVEHFINWVKIRFKSTCEN